jgi:hypothetical protein
VGGASTLRVVNEPRPSAAKCRRHFLEYFPEGFRDATYLETERDYKWRAHERWLEELGPRELARLIARGAHAEVAARAVSIESRTNLLFSFEKMALRDAMKTGAETFARGLHAFLHGRGARELRFERWIEVLRALPRRRTRVLTWPVATVFGMIARPDEHLFLKPMVTRAAAQRYGFAFDYVPGPCWSTYASALAFAERVRREQRDLRPRDVIDLQGFIWVSGSEEYPW